MLKWLCLEATIAYITIDLVVDISSVSMSLTSARKVNVKHFISDKTHKPNALRFLVNMWCVSRLFGETLAFSWVFDPMWMSPPHNDPTLISKPCSTKAHGI